MTAKKEIETHAATCRTARADGRPLPVWCGAILRGADLRQANLRDVNLRGAVLREADLSGADLSEADLTGANLRHAILRGAFLRGADLTGADLTGALITEGAITAHTAGRDGGYNWYALRVADGGIILQYGCERHPLATWQARGPEYGDHYDHDEAHWAIGPAIAIAAAEALITKPTRQRRKEAQ